MAKPFEVEEAPFPNVLFSGMSIPDLLEILGALKNSSGDKYLCDDVRNERFEHAVATALDYAPAMNSWGVLAWVAREARRADKSDDGGEIDYFNRWDLFDQAFAAFVFFDEVAADAILAEYRRRWRDHMVADVKREIEARKAVQ